MMIHTPIDQGLCSGGRLERYAAFQSAQAPVRLVDRHMEATGYRRGQGWITLKFEGAEHSEAS